MLLQNMIFSVMYWNLKTKYSFFFIDIGFKIAKLAQTEKKVSRRINYLLPFHDSRNANISPDSNQAQSLCLFRDEFVSKCFFI